MTRVALLHAYSPRNSGDGLLVQEALTFIHESLGSEVDIDLFASRAEDFAELRLPRTTCISTKPTRHGLSRDYLRRISHLDSYDLVVGVGGAYLRFGQPIEALKSWLVHVPQLYLASRTTTPTVYLPQSCGPFGPLSRHVVPRMMSRMNHAWLRDDRSIAQCRMDHAHRAPDCALLSLDRIQLPFDDMSSPIVGSRTLRGHANQSVAELARLVGPVDGLVQSAVGANNDAPTTSRIATGELFDQAGLQALDRARVVVSVRLHGAIMALAAGHYVVHLSYERKGFGAFEDLGLTEYVHNVYSFSPATVANQVRTLQQSPEARSRYDECVARAQERLHASRRAIVTAMHTATMGARP